MPLYFFKPYGRFSRIKKKQCRQSFSHIKSEGRRRNEKLFARKCALRQGVWRYFLDSGTTTPPPSRNVYLGA